MNCKYLILFFVMLPPCGLNSQIQNPDEEGIKNSVFVKNVTETIRAELLSYDSRPIRIRSDRFYYWFKAQKILHTQGGFGGRVLDGKYTAYFPDNNLKETGYFRAGLKIGKWQCWFVNGQLMEETSWRRGLKSGNYIKYNTDKLIELKGKYRKDKFFGKKFKYSEDGIEVTQIRGDIPKKNYLVKAKGKLGDQVKPDDVLSSLKGKPIEDTVKINVKPNVKLTTPSQLDSNSEIKKLPNSGLSNKKNQNKSKVGDSISKNPTISVNQSSNKLNDKNISNIKEDTNIKKKKNGKLNFFQKIRGWFSQ